MATAGNKSLLPYRIGVGVTGYTGFIPASESIAVPVKRGSMLRAELDRGTAEHGDGGTIAKAKSTFTEAYSLTPAQFALGTMPNALWDVSAKRPVGDPPFVQRPVDPLDGKRPVPMGALGLDVTWAQTLYNDPLVVLVDPDGGMRTILSHKGLSAASVLGCATRVPRRRTPPHTALSPAPNHRGSPPAQERDA